MPSRISALLVYLFTFAALAAPPAAADAPLPGGGEVKIPLSTWQQLMQGGNGGGAPVSAAGKAAVSVNIGEDRGRLRAQVSASLSLRVLGERGGLVVLLPIATVVDSVTVDGAPVELVPTAEGLAWPARSMGSHTVALSYTVEALRTGSGWSLALPLPRASSSEVSALLPGAGLEVAVVPAASFRTEAAGASTRVTANVPASPSLLLSWLAPAREGFSLSRATYQGELRGDAIAWTATLGLDLFSSEARVPLFPRSATLAEVLVDGRSASVMVEGDRFVVAVAGKGRHELSVRFETQVEREEGPPSSAVQVPEVPMSRFELRLPGRKELKVEPEAAVTTTLSGGQTMAVLHMPMTSELRLSWSEAVPEEVRAELSTNASLFHAIEAEEGVLHVRALAVFEITRGETSEFSLSVPAGIEVTRVQASQGGIADWRLEAAAGDKPAQLRVFLDRKVRGEFRFEVEGEKLLGTEAEQTARIVVPLLSALKVYRQRGMAAILMGPELGLEPVEEKGLTRVGESQLPPAFRDGLGKPVAATWKYVETDTALVVKATQPEHKAGLVDAQIDTLVSIGEVSLRGRSSIALHVKSGSILEVAIELPADLNVLGLSAPSLRTWSVKTEGALQLASAEFTQEMEGDLRLELSWERVLGEATGPVAVPLPLVRGAESEHGRIAVEALAAVEVRPASAERVSGVDVGELPQQLVLQTTNPILLAWKYVRGEAEPRLALEIARHKEAEVQAAAIEDAHYRTLFTADGLAVTTAHLVVRNARRQFLELALPPASEVWSVFVDGKGEKPALAATGTSDGKPGASAGPRVLIRLASSTTGFPVEIVYATRVARLGFAGTLTGMLPRPDVVATRSRWDLFLPEGPSWARPGSNMDLVQAASVVDGRVMAEAASKAADSAVAGSLRIAVPARGVHFAFEKLYANQSGDDAFFRIRYATGAGRALGTAMATLAALLFWGGVASLLGLLALLPRRLAQIAVFAGPLAALAALVLLGTSPWLLAGLSAALVAAAVVRPLLRRWSTAAPHPQQAEL